MKKALSFLAALTVSMAALANTVELNPEQPDRYTVVPGDTLWDIAGKFLRDPWQWPEIWHINQQIANPHLIYPGDHLRLVWRDGKPVIQMTRGGENGQPKSIVKLSPKARPMKLSKPVPTVPLNAISPFLQHSRVVGRDELDKAAYVLTTRDGRLLSGARDKVYVRGLKDSASDYRIYRKGQVYRDPDNHKILGYEALYVGDARVMRRGDPSTIKLTNTNREVMSGDRLLPRGEDDAMSLHFTPRAPDQTVDGRIIAVVDGVSRIGQYQVVVLNLGRRQQMERGHVLSIFQSGRQVKDRIGGGHVKLPEEKAGDLMVFRSFDKVSYALVMTALTDIKVKDKVANPR